MRDPEPLPLAAGCAWVLLACFAVGLGFVLGMLVSWS